MNNRLYCTFVPEENIESTIDKIQTSYSILFNKIFVLESLDGEKIMLTYNVDMGNSNGDFLVNNTILVHRKKYSVGKSLNNGFLDKSYAVNWNEYRNCMLLVQAEGYKRVDTKVRKIINIS